MTRHLLVAHGSPDPRHGAVVRSVAAAVSARGLPCTTAFLEYYRPLRRRLADGRRGTPTAPGLLLAPGYHARVDVPRLLQAGPDDVVDRGVLGAGPWLDVAMDEALAAVGGDAATPVVVVSAGSSRPEARRHVEEYVARWAGRTLRARLGGHRSGGPRRVVDGSGRDHRAALPEMLGIFSDRIADAADDAGLRTSPVLGVTEGFVDAVIHRLGASLPVR